MCRLSSKALQEHSDAKEIGSSVILSCIIWEKTY